MTLKIFVNLTMTLKIFINLITTLKMFINFIGNIFYRENITAFLYIVNVTLLLTSYIYTYKHCTWRSATAVKTLVQECCEKSVLFFFLLISFIYIYMKKITLCINFIQREYFEMSSRTIMEMFISSYYSKVLVPCLLWEWTDFYSYARYIMQN
jgi:hypothetical protein